MLSFARRFRTTFVRLGLCLIAVVSLAAIVVLLSQSILASTAGAKSSKMVATNSHVPALTLKPDSGVGEVTLISSNDELASIERARAQMTSLVSVNDAIDWTALADMDESELLPMSFEDIDEIALIAGMDPAFADWMPLAGEVGQVARADNDMGSGSYGGGGGARSGWAGGGGGGGATGLGAFSGGSGSRSAGSLDGSNGFSGVAGDGFVDIRSSNASSNALSNGQSGVNSNGRAGDGPNGNAIANGRGSSNGVSGDVPPGLVRAGGPGGDVTSVPEPSTLLLMAVGLSSLTLSKLRGRRAGR